MKRLKYLLASLLVMAILFSTVLFHSSEVEAAEAITYTFEGIQIPEGMPSTLTVDEGTLALFAADNSMIDSFLTALALKYNYGANQINQSVEKQYILAVIAGSLPGGLHIPSYIQTVTPYGLMYGNGTYIDINRTSQQLIYYENGAAKYITDIVTGNVSAGHDTPSGVFQIQYKQLDRTLKGEDYESFVHYWMRFVGNVGIHDASWRSKFGGDIYLTNGSHGCVNVPPAMMPYLYEACPEGTVVVVHD
ncbi:L,D-transpeptidase [Lachnospiraceae bacterium C1.1]|nr:L,D-transpeptidase [Lachnospiraceae bacterium C1.1]